MERKIGVYTDNNPDTSMLPDIDPPYILKCRLETNTDLYYINMPVLIFVLFLNNKNKLTLDEYQRKWMNLPQSQNNMNSLQGINPNYQNVENVKI